MAGIPFTNSYCGRGSGIILLDDVGCTGSEDRLLDCFHTVVGVHDSYCDHFDDAGVRCISKHVLGNLYNAWMQHC